MKDSCREIEEALWEHAHTGSVLPEDVRRHVDSCPDCAQVIKEGKQILCAASDDYAAAAPDCRSAVMDRIAKPAPRFRPVWAYACAVAALAALIVGGLEMRGPSPQPRRLVSVGTKQHTAPVPRVEIEKQPTTNVRQRVPVRQQRPQGVRRIRHFHPAPVRERPILVRVTPPPVSEDVTPRPIAAVIVTGVVDERSPDMSYGYRERDAATGVVTECSVNRSGNSIDIRMESTPGGEKPPVKGSIDNEKNSNA